MKKFIYLVVIIFFAAGAAAQSSGKIEGSVVNKTSGAEGATVVLLRASDSVPLKKSAANKDGRYYFENLAAGKYLVGATSVGYQKSFSKVIELKPGETATVPPIQLLPANKELAGVTVTGKRPLIEQRTDRTIVNVDAMISNTGTTALDVLENSPGVTVDKDGNISLKGKDGVMVFVDGRPTQLSGADLANLLRNMNANQLDQLEIMTNPPAKYDASGTAGIINIKTKKIITAGSNGTVSVSYMQGRYPKTTEGFNFNHRNKKINLFTNLSHSYRSAFGNLLVQRNIFNASGDELENYFDQKTIRRANGNSYSGKLGLDYFLNKSTTLGIVLNANSSPGFNSSNTITKIFSPANELEQINNAAVGNNQRWKNFSTNLNFRSVLDKKGKELSSDFDFATFNSASEQFMVNAYLNAKADSLQSYLPQEIKIYSGRIDYLHPINKTSKFEAGIKSSYVQTDNDAAYDSIQNGNKLRDYNRSNHFVYEENINAVYANMNTSVSKKLSVQLGLRMENTNAKGMQLTTGETFTRHYTQLFPTAYLEYKANAKNSILLNYGRRVRRPGYGSLNPFIRFIDKYTYNKGNPALAPELSDNVELTHSWNNMISTTLNYSFTSDVIGEVIQQKGQEAVNTPENIAWLRQYGISVNANTPVNKWWMSNITINVFNNKYKGVVDRTPVAVGKTSVIINGLQQFKLSKTLSAELTGRYRSGWYEGLIRTRSLAFFGAGISQQMLKGKGTLKIAARDIFHSQKLRGTSKYGNVDVTVQQTADTQVLTVGFTYRFSKGKKIAPVKRTAGSANEEQNRIGGND